ncbi:hypothetical protein HDU93_007352 [Gonapodya sp. JEL0774]|nr:hypothetical protein HDU93_007352 [Gonapodya sp. JEL0774]
MVPMGLGVASATRIGILVGEGASINAKTSSRVALLLAAGIGVSNFCILCFGVSLPAIFTNDSYTVELAQSILPIAALFQINDALATTSGGILRGIGRQKVSAMFALVGFYGVGIPAGSYLCFRWKSLRGLWWGLLLGTCLSVLQVMTILVTDWEGEVFRADRTLQVFGGLGKEIPAQQDSGPERNIVIRTNAWDSPGLLFGRKPKQQLDTKSGVASLV